MQALRCAEFYRAILRGGSIALENVPSFMLQLFEGTSSQRCSLNPYCQRKQTQSPQMGLDLGATVLIPGEVWGRIGKMNIKP